MSQESEEKLAKIENKIQNQLVETIKASRQEYDSKQRSITSMSSIIKDNTLEIIEKIDSKIPSYVKLYSDLYKKYFGIMSTIYNASYLSQKEFYFKWD